MLGLANGIAQADATLRPQLTDAVLAAIVAEIPDVWLGQEETFANQDDHRAAYLRYLTARRDGASNFVEEAANAHAALL
ncbi:MAG: hypothetical protein R2932_16045 [Caldilineaceae bacterium]